MRRTAVDVGRKGAGGGTTSARGHLAGGLSLTIPGGDRFKRSASFDASFETAGGVDGTA